MGLVIGAVLVAVGVMMFLLIPILRGDQASFARTEEDPSEVGARKHVALKGLRDAEYDFQAGKLDETDYKQIKAEMAREALEAMKADDDRSGDAEDDPAPAASADDLLEAEILRARRGLADGRTCLECGDVNREGSRFCAGCGRPLSVAAAGPAEGR